VRAVSLARARHALRPFARTYARAGRPFESDFPPYSTKSRFC
jgi:hypothetical protein